MSMFSQNPFVELNFGISNLNINEIPSETPGFHKGSLIQLEMGNDFNLRKKYVLHTSFFYRESKNALNIDWINDAPNDIKNDVILNTKLVGIESELMREYSFRQNSKLTFTPKIGFDVALFTDQNFINPGFDNGFTIDYENYTLDKYNNKVKILSDMYFSNLIGVNLNYNFKRLNVYLIPTFEYQLNHLFRKKYYDESYINLNLGFGIKYNFSDREK